MDYLLFYWAFSSLFAYNFFTDKKSCLFGHYLFMFILGCLFGWFVLPVVIGKAIDKILNS